MLDIPGAHLLVVSSEEMHMITGNRNILVTPFEDFHFDVIGTNDESNTRNRPAAEHSNIVDDLCTGRRRLCGDHLVAGRNEAIDHRAQIRNGEADMIDRTADRRALRVLLPEKHQRIRKLVDRRTGTESARNATERIAPESLVRVHVGNIQMIMAVGNRALCQELSARAPEARQ